MCKLFFDAFLSIILNSFPCSDFNGSINGEWKLPSLSSHSSHSSKFVGNNGSNTDNNINNINYVAKVSFIVTKFLMLFGVGYVVLIFRFHLPTVIVNQ